MSIGTLIIICDSEATRFERRQDSAKNDNVVLYKEQNLMYNVYYIIKFFK